MGLVFTADCVCGAGRGVALSATCKDDPEEPNPPAGLDQANRKRSKVLQPRSPTTPRTRRPLSVVASSFHALTEAERDEHGDGEPASLRVCSHL